MKRSRRLGALALVGALLSGGVAWQAKAAPPPGEADRVRGVLNGGVAAAGGSGGTTGFYVKQVGGPVLLAENETFPHDPASALKALLHLLAMRTVEGGVDVLSNIVFWWPYPNNRNMLPATDPNLCPKPSDESFATHEEHRLDDTLFDMMMNSDNRATRAIEMRYGKPRGNALADDLGMSQTEWRQIFGCADDGDFENSSTLADLGRVYEGVAAQTALDEPARTSFYDLMPGFSYQPGDPFDAMLREEGRAFGVELTDEFVADFVTRMRVAFKPGNYSYGNGQVTVEEDGSLVVPMCDADRNWVSNSFVWGAFVARVSGTTAGDMYPVVERTFLESFRSVLSDSLRSCGYGPPPPTCPPFTGLVTATVGPTVSGVGYYVGPSYGEYFDEVLCYVNSLGL